MAKKFLGKFYDMIGLEEEDDMMEDDFAFEEEKPAKPSKKTKFITEDYKDVFEEEAEPRPAKKSVREKESKVVGLEPSNKMKVVVYQPITYDDTQNIIDNLKTRRPVVVNLENLEVDVAQRVLDFMSGAAYALNGNIQKISKGIFLLAPSNVDVSGNIPDELKGKSFYTLGGSQTSREY